MNIHKKTVLITLENFFVIDIDRFLNRAERSAAAIALEEGGVKRFLSLFTEKPSEAARRRDLVTRLAAGGLHAYWRVNVYAFSSTVPVSVLPERVNTIISANSEGVRVTVEPDTS